MNNTAIEATLKNADDEAKRGDAQQAIEYQAVQTVRVAIDKPRELAQLLSDALAENKICTDDMCGWLAKLAHNGQDTDTRVSMIDALVKYQIFEINRGNE